MWLLAMINSSSATSSVNIQTLKSLKEEIEAKKIEGGNLTDVGKGKGVV